MGGGKRQEARGHMEGGVRMPVQEARGDVNGGVRMQEARGDVEGGGRRQEARGDLEGGGRVQVQGRMQEARGVVEGGGRRQVQEGRVQVQEARGDLNGGGRNEARADVEESDADLAVRLNEADKHVWPTERNKHLIDNPYKQLLEHNVDGQRGSMEYLAVFTRLNSAVNFCEIIVEELGQDYVAVDYPGDVSLNQDVLKRVKQLANQIIRSPRV
jgi:hypothetical protein